MTRAGQFRAKARLPSDVSDAEEGHLGHRLSFVSLPGVHGFPSVFLDFLIIRNLDRVQNWIQQKHRSFMDHVQLRKGQIVAVEWFLMLSIVTQTDPSTFQCTSMNALSSCHLGSLFSWILVTMPHLALDSWFFLQRSQGRDVKVEHQYYCFQPLQGIQQGLNTGLLLFF